MSRAGLLLVVLVAASCQGKQRTLLFLEIETGPRSGAAVYAIDVALTLAGKSAAVTLRESSHTPIAFPTSELFELAAGAGKLDLVAIARDAAGAELARVAGSVTIVSAQSQALTLGFAGSPIDAAAPNDGASDAAAAPLDLLAPADLTAATATATAPGAPRNVLGTGGALSAAVSWTAPTNDGGSAILVYIVTSSPDQVQSVVSAPATNTTVDGLRADVSYTFTVAAMNAVGIGPASAPSAAVTTLSNLAYQSTASASSTFAGYDVARIKDGDLSTALGGATSWANAMSALPAWVELDFPATSALTQARLFTTASYPIQDYTLQVWDGATWNIAVTVTGNTAAIRVHDLTGYTGSKLRLVGTSGPAAQTGYVRVNELEVY